MTRLEKAAVMWADMTKKRTFADDPHDFKKQLASNMTILYRKTFVNN